MKRANGTSTASSIPNAATSTSSIAPAIILPSSTTVPTSASTTGPSTISLNRRRGTPKSRWNNANSSPLQILAIIALALTLLLGVLFITYNTNHSMVSSAALKNSHIVQHLPGVPYLLRGKIDPIKQIPPAAVSEEQRKLNNHEDRPRPINDLPGDMAHLRDGHQDQQFPNIVQFNEHNKNKEEMRKEMEQADATSNEEKQKNMYDTKPTKLYPYSLKPVPEGYNIATDYKVLGGKRFLEYTTGGTPYVITEDIIEQSNIQARSRRTYVQNTMKFVWGNYIQHSFGSDELKPQGGYGDDRWGGHGVTLVDSLDTLWLMGMKTEFYQARDWVRDHLDFSRVGTVSVFETTIRDLGGLLSAHSWSNDTVFLDKALDLGERLLHSFDGSTTGIPFGQVSLSGGHVNNLGWTGNSAILAEFGTIQIEYNYLAKATGKDYLATKPSKVFEIMQSVSPENGLYPYFWANTGRSDKPYATNDKVTFGAMADSFYEYMLKVWLQTDRKISLYREMYDKAMDGMHNELLRNSVPSGLRYIADKNGGFIDQKMDHLVCFMGGLLALGAYTNPDGLDSPRSQRDLRTGKALTYTCYQMYARMNTGISAEYVQFEDGNDFVIGRGAPHYLLRPEAVESFFILSYLTKDPIYREWGWEAYQSIEKYCKTKYGYGALSNVQDTHANPRDSMESFFLAETLKYLYLLQDPDTEVDILHKHVFNTEAHPVRIFSQMSPPVATTT
jgi:Glycosyl hydrolase family 47